MKHCLPVRGPLAVAALLLAGASALAQPPGPGLPRPRLMLVTPAGGKAGTTVEVTVGGQSLEAPEKLLFSQPGIKAELLPPPAPPLDPKTGKPKPGMPAPVAGIAKFKVTIPPDTPLGIHDIRVVNASGVSNPRAFVVGDQVEVAEKEPNNEDTQAQKVDLNTTITGAFSSPTDVDYYSFSGKKDQRVVISCLASSIDSRAKPSIEVYDDKGRQLAANRHYKEEDALTDLTLPADGTYQVRVCQFTFTFRQPIPLPGAIPPGMADHFYRLSLSTAPWIDAVFPPVVEPGKATTVTVWGRNLPGGKPDPQAVLDDVVLEKVTVPVTPPADAEAKFKLAYSGHVPPQAAHLDGFELRLRNDSGSSNPFLLAYATAPVVVDNGDNDTPEKAQVVSLPCEIAGRVEKRRDRDWYAFTAKKGETWTIEVQSNRLGAPTYMAISLRNPAAKGEIYESPIAEPPNLYPRHFFARSEDPPAYRFTAPADGTYHLLVHNRTADVSGGYGPRHTYRVRIGKDQPDFRLVALDADTHIPGSVTVAAGGADAFSVLAFREEGFTGDIELSVEGLPPGLTAVPQTINGNTRLAHFVVSAAASAAPWAGEVKIKGTATINGTKVVREARAGDIVWPVQPQQNLITVSRLSRGLYLAVRDKAAFVMGATIDKNAVVQGDKATIKVTQERFWPDFKNPLIVQVALTGQNQGPELPNTLRVNNNQPLNLAATQKEGSLAVTVGADVPPGTYNLVLRGTGQIPYNKDPKAKGKQNTNITSFVPISFTVLPKSLATLTVSNANPTVKVGQQAEVVVKVARKYGYDGEFKVSLEVPASVKGLEPVQATIPPGKDEVKLVIKAAADAMPGNRPNLVVKAVALFQGKTPTPHETKINVNVVK